MNVIVRMGILVLVVLGLAACGAAEGSTTGEAASSATAVAPAADINLTDEMKLMLGTMKLDEVSLPPDAEQASELLLLWQAYQSLATSDTAASQEMEAVLAQIERAMTAEQLAAIAAMDLDQEDLNGLMESFRQETTTGEGSSGDGFLFSGGEPPAGGPGRLVIQGEAPAGGPPAGAEGLSPEMQATAQAGMATRAGNPSALFLLRPLIAELQTLAKG